MTTSLSDNTIVVRLATPAQYNEIDGIVFDAYVASGNLRPEKVKTLPVRYDRPGTVRLVAMRADIIVGTLSLTMLWSWEDWERFLNGSSFLKPSLPAMVGGHLAVPLAARRMGGFTALHEAGAVAALELSKLINGPVSSVNVSASENASLNRAKEALGYFLCPANRNDPVFFGDQLLAYLPPERMPQLLENLKNSRGRADWKWEGEKSPAQLLADARPAAI